MSENCPQPPDLTRQKAVEAAGWTAGLAALFIMSSLSAQPTWPIAIGAVAVAAMVAAVCYFMLHKR